MTHDVFISHSSNDIALANVVCSALEAEGINCWLAPRDISPGQDWPEAIVEAITESLALVLIFSFNAKDSEHVQNELAIAVDSGVFIIPLRFDDIPLEGSMQYYLSDKQWLDVTNPPSESEIQILTETIRSQISDRDTQHEHQIPVLIQKPVSESNPFTFGNPIRDPARFFGRKTEIRQIISRLKSSAHESTSVVGERRIGKTSLLYHLSNPEVASTLGMPVKNYCLVYIDFQGLTDITPHRFWQRVLTKMSRSVCDESLSQSIDDLRHRDTFDLFDLEDLFEEINSKGLTTVLFMDEFEYVTQNSNFDSDFFGGLRALAIHYDFALVPSTRRELVDLCHSDEIKGSPFFNIFASVFLRPFTTDEMDGLIDGYLQDITITLTQEERTFVKQLGGGYPFFLQMAGFYLLEGKQLGLLGDDLKNYSTIQFDAQAAAHYNYYWLHCSESEKITLLALLALSQQKQTKKTVATLENLGRLYARTHLDLPSLHRRGIVIETDGTYKMISKSLERWIAREITSTPDEEENQASVEQWLAEGGRESFDTVKGVLPKFKKKYWPIVGSVIKEMSFELAGAATFELLLKALL